MGSRIRTTSTALICAISMGCADSTGPFNPVNDTIVAVSVGAEHSCALAGGGAIYCWGSDQAGQLGTAGRHDSAVPIKVAADVGFVKLAAGALHTCALVSRGDLYCWGYNGSGQQGNASTISIETPVINPRLRDLVDITSGWFHSCALNATGVAFCWGMGGQGQLGTAKYADSLVPDTVVGGHRFAVLSAGAYHTCGIALDGTGYCWGQNQVGQLGNGSTQNSASPVPVGGNLRFSSISAGLAHSCGVARDGAGYCWGASEFGEAGTRALLPPGVPASLTPSAVFGSGPFRSISAGNGFTCAVELTGAGLCWGRGLEGQLGNGQIRNWPTPQHVLDQKPVAGNIPIAFEWIAVGARTHACGLTTSAAVFCWGQGIHGELGNAVMSQSALAIRVSLN